MFPLDRRTVERLAQIIVDADGPYERKGWELEALLRSASWPSAPEYDGSPRVPWLVAEFEEHREDRAAVERLLCRVCDPLEYDDGITTAEEFRASVNTRLKPEGLAIALVDGRPVVEELAADGTSIGFSAPPNLEARLRALIGDEDSAEVLVRRATEAQICDKGGAYTMAVVCIGSLVEGMLLAVLQEHDADARAWRFVNRNGETVHKDRPAMELLIHTAQVKGWIQLDAAEFVHKVRGFRNFIHPRLEVAAQARFDADTVKLCWGPVQAMLNDLEQRVRTPA
ncbi:hypothetical protein ACFPZ0_01190 [Streptomonospora nanhaiensis]|uniref:hypothetical protein n=1 Tax=Streptomonospora nanhaiensis TaxID=1323731 RepID=UPI001C3850E2|nr:hypothetical protein [Streptomonospora nanhaiensis]MBV2365729.1 hypothetical protein [Streptomonospora nanhaiensis]MBX9387547.1 hypothetical protein [Streptomonospora nanhaiensis]